MQNNRSNENVLVQNGESHGIRGGERFKELGVCILEEIIGFLRSRGNRSWSGGRIRNSRDVSARRLEKVSKLFPDGIATFLKTLQNVGAEKWV